MKKSAEPVVTDPEWCIAQAREAVRELNLAIQEYGKGGVDDAEIKFQVAELRDRLCDILRIYRRREEQYNLAAIRASSRSLSKYRDMVKRRRVRIF